VEDEVFHNPPQEEEKGEQPQQPFLSPPGQKKVVGMMRLLPDRRVSDKRSAEPEIIHFYGDEIQRTYTEEPVIALGRLGISDLPVVQAEKIILALLVELETVAAHIA